MIRTLHISSRKQVVLDTWTLAAEHVHEAFSIFLGLPTTLAGVSHEVNFGLAHCVCAAKPCFSCLPGFHRRTSACSCLLQERGDNITCPTTTVQSICVGAWEESALFSCHSHTSARDMTLLFRKTPEKHQTICTTKRTA